MGSFLADPRRPSTSLPLARLKVTPAQRDDRYSGRLPDVGGHVPVLGRSLQLGDGRVGGVISGAPEPLRSGLERSAIPKVSQAAAGRLGEAVKKELDVIRTAVKTPVKVQAGPSFLGIAVKGPQRVDARGQVLYRRGLTDQVPLPRTRGQFAQQRTAPIDVSRALVTGRLTRAVAPAGYLGKGRAAAPDVLPVSDQVTAAISGGAAIVLPGQGDQGSPLVSPAPVPVLTEGLPTPSGAQQAERYVFLAGVVLVAWLIFRGRG